MKAIEKAKAKYDPRTPFEERKFLAFDLVCQGVPLKEVANQCKVLPATVSAWKKTDWWKRLHEEYISTRMRDVQMNMARAADQLFDGYMEIMTGVDKSDKTSNARINGFKLFLESGNDPVIKKNPSVNITTNTQNNTVITDESLGKLSQEELLEFARTGKMPEKIKEIN